MRRGIACHFGTLKSPKGTVKELKELFDARVDIFERSTLQRLAADLVDSHGLRDPAEATTFVHSVVASAAYGSAAVGDQSGDDDDSTDGNESEPGTPPLQRRRSGPGPGRTVVRPVRTVSFIYFFYIIHLHKIKLECPSPVPNPVPRGRRSRRSP